MRLIFMGTPDFSVTALAALIGAGHEIACVYSQPPRPAGRGMTLRPTPVHAFADAKGISVRTPASLKSLEEQTSFAALQADVAVVVAYGLLLPKSILVAPRFGCLNIHASLLPRWRGAAPIQRAIMAGDVETGVTIMQMDEGLDTGPMLHTATCSIDASTTTGSLHDELAALGAKAIVDVLDQPLRPGIQQPGSGVTYAKKIDKAEAKIDFNRPAIEVLRHIHGLSPFPGAWLQVGGVRVKILKCRLNPRAGPSGIFIDDALTIACGTQSIQCLELQREGKGVMQAHDFLRGFPVAKGIKVT